MASTPLGERIGHEFDRLGSVARKNAAGAETPGGTPTSYGYDAAGRREVITASVHNGAARGG